MENYSQVDILAFGSHPDDVVFGVGGILLKMAAKGHKIALVDATSGDMGTNGTVRERENEEKEASRHFGAQCVFLKLPDTELQETPEIRKKLAYWIRIFKPKLILAPDTQYEMNHPDHSALGSMARGAMRFSKFKKILAEITPHKAQGILHYHYPSNRMPDFLVDISEYANDWVKTMECYKSQLKTQDYIERNLKVAAYFGSLIGVKYAQGLIKHNPVLIDDILDISQGVLEF